MSMNRRRAAALGSVLTTLAVLGLADVRSSLGQERASAPKAAASQARRVPPYFGQIGITPQQREQIYTIRADYDTKISELIRQLEELKGAEMAACEGVLTPAQLQLLDQLRLARRSRTPARTAPAEADTPPPALNNVKVEEDSPKDDTPG